MIAGIWRGVTLANPTKALISNSCQQTGWKDMPTFQAIRARSSFTLIPSGNPGTPSRPLRVQRRAVNYPEDKRPRGKIFVKTITMLRFPSTLSNVSL